MADFRALIDDYLAGPGLLRQATRRMSGLDRSGIENCVATIRLKARAGG